MQKLKAPTKEQRAAGLPTSRKDAIKMGVTRYMRGGEEWVIRGYGTKNKGQGVDERASTRKATRGGGSDGARATYEDLSTYGSDKKQFGKSMTRAIAVGNQGDHTRDAARVAHGLKGKPERQRRQRIRNWRRAKLPVGNDKNNVSSLTPEKNTKIKPAETRALDKALKEMEQRNPSKRQTRKPGNIRGSGMKNRSQIKIPSGYMRPPVAVTNKLLKRRGSISLLNTSTLGSDSHPLGGSVVDTDPLLGQGLRMRTL